MNQEPLQRPTPKAPTATKIPRHIEAMQLGLRRLRGDGLLLQNALRGGACHRAVRAGGRRMRAIREAYETSSKVAVQGTDRVVLQGRGRGLTIEMWFNKATNTIETAYPVVP